MVGKKGKIAFLNLMMFSCLFATDFSVYIKIEQSTKQFLRTNWLSRFSNSGFTAGNVAVFGNSITNTRAFWVPFAYNEPGVVPGTNAASYIIDKDNTINCATSRYTIDNGIQCLVPALDNLKPEVILCEYGTNDVNDGNIGSFGTVYRRYIDTVLSRGVIPIVSTVPPRGDNRELVTIQINDTIKSIAVEKKIVLVDFYQAFMDHTGNNPFTDQWMDAERIHPSGGCALTEMTQPQCGYAIRNAVSWHAVNKVLRIIIDNGAPDYGGTVDTIPPATITDLTAEPAIFAGMIKLTWTAPGENGTLGTATAYEIRYSEQPLTNSNFLTASLFSMPARPKTAGSSESVYVSNLSQGRTYYFGIKATDGHNVSILSNVASVVVPATSSAFKDSLVLSATEDTYLESGTDADSCWGTKSHIRVKAGGQGVPLLKFDLSTLAFTPDSAVLSLIVDSNMPAESDYSYTVEVCGLIVPWSETTSSYTRSGSQPGWIQNSPRQSLDRTVLTTAQYTGTRAGQRIHHMPVSIEVIRGIYSGKYFGIGIWETGSNYNNCHFSSKESGAGPVLKLYSFALNTSSQDIKKNRSRGQNVQGCTHNRNKYRVDIFTISGERVYHGMVDDEAGLNKSFLNFAGNGVYVKRVFLAGTKSSINIVVQK